MKYIVFVLLFFTHTAFAQRFNDFGNAENPATLRLFSAVPIVKDIWLNDGLNFIEFDPTTRYQVDRVKKKISHYVSDSMYYVRNYTHIVVTDSSFMEYEYKNGDRRMMNMGKTIFIIARDTTSYIAIFTEKQKYTLYYNREVLPPTGAEHDLFNDPKIRGVYPNLDQMKNLGQLLDLYLPHPGDQSESKK